MYNRGVDRRTIFENKKDFFRFYLSLGVFNSIEPSVNFELSRNKKILSSERLVSIHAYALLPNHFHLLIEQKSDGGISEFMKRVSTGYTSYFNDRHQRSGVLFQGRFKRVQVENDEQYRYLLAYVNENHTVHNIQQPNEIIYTSSMHYCNSIKSKLVQDDYILNEEYDHKQSILLAQDIYERREQLKSTIFED